MPMRHQYFQRLTFILAIISSFGLSNITNAGPKHGIAMYGDPALPPDFVSLPYANPNAPKGGKLVMGETGSFDTINPLILKGSPPWQLRFLAYESLMLRSYAEPFALYGLLAESIETAPDRSWVEFTLRKEARFSDGSLVTIEDVIWSYEILGTQGHPRYRGFWNKVDRIEQTAPSALRIYFNVKDPELTLIAGLRPIIKKAQWQGLEFSEANFNIAPITTAPYIIEKVEPGRTLVLRRDENYWGKDLPIRRGTNNLDQIVMEFYGDQTVLFEAFKGGSLSAYRENNADKWSTQYDFPAVKAGDIVKSEIPHQRPSGMRGFAMNTRQALFADWRVRDAMIHAFNFEYINDVVTAGRQQRIGSYFSNSVLGFKSGPAEGLVKEALLPFAEELLPGALGGYELPVSDGSERNRANIRKAISLMADAGWRVQDGVMRDEEGNDFAFELLIKQGNPEDLDIAELFRSALERMGIDMTITRVDSAQYKERVTKFDFDMTSYQRGLSLSPGNEQYLYFGTKSAAQEGSRNLMGAQSEVIDSLIDRVLNARDQNAFVANIRALDRVLTTQRYVIPFYQWPISRIAHQKNLRYPQSLPIYGDWLGFMPDVWWYEE